jgi:hypothetical protein
MKPLPEIKPNATTPTEKPQIGQGEETPPGWEFFDELKNKTHLQMLATMFPKFAEALANQDIKHIEGTAGIFSGFRLDLGVPIPEWAKAASRKFWDGMGFEFLTTFEGQASQIGKLVGLGDIIPKNDDPSKIERTLEAFSHQAKKEAVNASPEEHFEFAKGRKEAPKIIEKIQGVSQRTKIYAIIAGGWREVEKFESTEDLYLWLMTLKNTDAAAEYTIARNTKSREIRKICNRIGLKFHNQWTSAKPKSQIPATP